LKQQLNPSEGGVEKPAGKARRRVMPRHGEEEQRGQTASPPRQRKGSGLTQMVSVIEADNFSLHETSRGLRSGQLLFQGSLVAMQDAAEQGAFFRLFATRLRCRRQHPVRQAREGQRL